MRFCLLAVMALSCGCSLLKSRYAMDDPVYGEKYEDGADRGDLLGKAKQALDARHTDGLGGLYLGGGTQINPRSESPMGGMELGTEGYATNWLTARGALSLFVGEDDYYGGLDAGLRIQPPTRVAPFLGIGTFHGASRKVENADDDWIDNDDDGWIDNDDDGWIDEHGENRESFDGWLSSVYPEVGTHFWMNGSWRLTGYGRYLITTEGRRHDDWLLGLQLTGFSR